MIWETIKDLFSTWYILLLLVALAALIGVLIYLRNRQEED